MSAKTHVQDAATDADTILVLLRALLSEGGTVVKDAVLTDLGVGAQDIGDLWAAVWEELVGRTMGPEFDVSHLNPAMTLSEVASAMASLLCVASTGEDDG